MVVMPFRASGTISNALNPKLTSVNNEQLENSDGRMGMQLCSQLSSCINFSGSGSIRIERTYLQLFKCAYAPCNPAQIVVVKRQGL